MLANKGAYNPEFNPETILQAIQQNIGSLIHSVVLYISSHQSYYLINDSSLSSLNKIGPWNSTLFC